MVHEPKTTGLERHVAIKVTKRN